MGRTAGWILALVFLVAFALWTKPDIKESGTIKIRDRNNILLYESIGSVGNKIPVTYDKLPAHLINAAVASEDESFWSNPGIDLKAIFRSAVLNVREKRIVSGASTITQQLARALVISPEHIPRRSIIRKIREIFIALRITTAYSKKTIMMMYLNQMYFGNLAYGIQAAAQTYFSKDVSQLSLAESAFLVGLLSSPDRRNPFTNLSEAKQNQIRVLDLMVKRGYISGNKSGAANKEELNLKISGTIIKAPHFVQYVLGNLETLGIRSGKGINVYTTLDYPVFTLSQEIASDWVGKLKKPHNLSNAALVLLKNDTGEIISMLGGIDYFDAVHAGQVNLATASRQPGSALKPVTYATAFMQGYTPATLIYDVKKVYKTKKGEGFIPHNYDGQFHGLVLAREALASSLNLPAVEMLDRVGVSNLIKTAKDMGITTFNQADRYDLSLTLGGGEVRLLDLTNVYSGFARGGEYKEAYAIKKIISDDGKTIYEHKDIPGTQKLGINGKQIAYLISDILSDSKARMPAFGEKNPLVLSHPAAVKTGTTTDWHDNWTLGYTPSYSVGVWTGNNDNSPMINISGVVGAAPIWNQFFAEFLKGKPQEKFIRPPGIVDRAICKTSGLLADDLCPEIYTEIFVENTEPKKVSDIYRKVILDKRNNLLAGESCPRETVYEKVFVNYPPEVYSWAMENDREVIPHKYSPLCTGSNSSKSTYIEITYPKNMTVFESAPLLVVNQSAVFEVNVSSDVTQAMWYVDDRLVGIAKTFPFQASWKPVAGKHWIQAKARTSDGKIAESEIVNISVVEFRDTD